jgi:hypothetical protein
MSMGHRCNDIDGGKPKYWEINLSPCHFTIKMSLCHFTIYPSLCHFTINLSLCHYTIKPIPVPLHHKPIPVALHHKPVPVPVFYHTNRTVMQSRSCGTVHHPLYIDMKVSLLFGVETVSFSLERSGIHFTVQKLCVLRPVSSHLHGRISSLRTPAV